MLLTERRTGGWTDGRTQTSAWQLLIEPCGRAGAENMAIDVALLEGAERTGDAFLRLYRFDPPCISFGRNEVTTGYDRAAIERLGLDVIRRPTGGGSVWHAHELTYAVAAPIIMFGGLRAAYRTIHERLAVALRSLGADATLSLHRPPPSSTDLHRHAPCFAKPAAGEILLAGRKLVGAAQVRRGRAFLQHGSILLDGSQDMIRVVSRKPQAVTGAITLSAALRRPVTFGEVAGAIVANWGDASTSTLLRRPPPSSTACFSDPAWTWRR